MSQENVRVIERMIAAVNDRDVECYLASCTEDVQLSTPLIGAVYDGPTGIRRFFADIGDTAPDFRITVERLEPVGADRVLAFLHVTARGRSSGLAMPADTANVYDLVDGKATRIQIFFDQAEALKAVGLEE